MGLAEKLVELLGSTMSDEQKKQPRVQSLLNIWLGGKQNTKTTGKWVGRAWVQWLEIEDAEGEHLATENEEWPEVEFEVALDSGSVVHVCAPTDTMGSSGGVARQ